MTTCYRHWYENRNYDMARNGETWLIERVARSSRKPCFFDVGANAGAWSAAARGRAPDATVHCFEILPSLSSNLEMRFSSDPAIKVNGYGLLDRHASVDVKMYPTRPEVSGLFDFPHEDRFTWTRGAVTTGDEYCASNGIKRINLLKIDTEGSEHLVIKGFSDMLAGHQIDLIQFEYGLVSIRSRFLLADHYALFEGLDYAMGKLFPTGVEFRPYNIWMDENFLGPNYVAVRRSRQDLIAYLSCKAPPTPPRP